PRRRRDRSESTRTSSRFAAADPMSEHAPDADHDIAELDAAEQLDDADTAADDMLPDDILETGAIDVVALLPPDGGEPGDLAPLNAEPINAEPINAEPTPSDDAAAAQRDSGDAVPSSETPAALSDEHAVDDAVIEQPALPLAAADDGDAATTADDDEAPAATDGETTEPPRPQRRRTRSQAVELPRDETLTAEVVTSRNDAGGVEDAGGVDAEATTELDVEASGADAETTPIEALELAQQPVAEPHDAQDVIDDPVDTAPAVAEDAEVHIDSADDHGEPDAAMTDDAAAVEARAEEQPVRIDPDQDDLPEAEEIPNGRSMDDPLDEIRPRRKRARSYKIQEVIKRRQVVLVQVVKEERGTKGAALTTYLSLAGRYTVLMPNTARGGGISRKITNAHDRKRLKAIAQELEVPDGMGLIIRTAGAARTKQEIKRDFEYLLRLWESVRDLTLRSIAPALVYEEGDLIKRSIRDLYSKDIDEICVAGDTAYKDAKDFMRMLMPSHAKNVAKYDGPGSLFADYGVEQKLADMFSPIVSLPSGGYLVINQTEALVAIDINSGKATREFSIEETALKTNLEAAEEIARQLKLRDLAGLIVIDFIDMDEKRNNRAVERRIKECLKRDRARIQVGRISHFGLLEMSRQRLRTGVLEGSTTQCPHCQGSGTIRSVESIALAVLRGVEDALRRDQGVVTVHAPTEVAFYLLNQKRQFIATLEEAYAATIRIIGSDTTQGSNFEIERPTQSRSSGRRAERAERAEKRAVRIDAGFEEFGEDADAGEPADDENGEDGDGQRGRRRRRRRGGRRSDGDNAQRATDDAQALDTAADEPDEERGAGSALARDGDDDSRSARGRRPRRRGRRGGRRGRTDGREGTSRGGDLTADANGFELEGYSAQAASVAVAALRIKTGDPILVDEIYPVAEPDAPVPDSEDAGEETGAFAATAATARDVDASEVIDRSAGAVHDTTTLSSANGAVPAAPSLQDVEVGGFGTGVADTVAQNAEPAPADEAGDNAVTEAPPPKRRARSLNSTAPVVRHVVVGAEATANEGEHVNPTGPRRKGWWQRTFG
ncbi:MAG: ribonuclease E/G, partial [Pseudomonadota bacterium]